MSRISRASRSKEAVAAIKFYKVVRRYGSNVWETTCTDKSTGKTEVFTSNSDQEGRVLGQIWLASQKD